ncbi:hypothetical protein PanWU01x14_340750 [Parasponia andersonii]|uniref:Uncharacterized protein n=1 Tax=Parasponia andersonii TaxID=3476 RepID=A0A2P5AED9_PARAD|nr:hypothetical protein PanWU01x14_340750 [Parasponia andersonii]
MPLCPPGPEFSVKSAYVADQCNRFSLLPSDTLIQEVVAFSNASTSQDPLVVAASGLLAGLMGLTTSNAAGNFQLSFL